MNSKMLILPGDRTGIRFGSKDAPYEAIRMQANIADPSLPEPFKTRYTSTDGKSRLPCNDVMIADSMKCENTIIYCKSASDEFKFSISGSGDIFHFHQRCDKFLKNFNWETETKLLDETPTEFQRKYTDDGLP